MTSRLLLVLTAGFSINAMAYDGPNECNITKNTVLTSPSIAHCESLNIAPGVTVVTHEFAFERRVDQKFVCGTPDQPCSIKCVGEGDTYEMGDKLCGATKVIAVIADGATDIVNPSGKVDLVFTGYTSAYRQRVNVAPAGRMSVYLNDEAVPVLNQESKYRWFN